MSKKPKNHGSSEPSSTVNLTFVVEGAEKKVEYYQDQINKGKVVFSCTIYRNLVTALDQVVYQFPTIQNAIKMGLPRTRVKAFCSAKDSTEVLDLERKLRVALPNLNIWALWPRQPFHLKNQIYKDFTEASSGLLITGSEQKLSDKMQDGVNTCIFIRRSAASQIFNTFKTIANNNADSEVALIDIASDSVTKDMLLDTKTRIKAIVADRNVVEYDFTREYVDIIFKLDELLAEQELTSLNRETQFGRAEDEYILENYGKIGLQGLAQELARSESSIQKRYETLKAGKNSETGKERIKLVDLVKSKGKTRFPTDEEITFIVQNYPSRGAKYCAKRLNASTTWVGQIAKIYEDADLPAAQAPDTSASDPAPASVPDTVPIATKAQIVETVSTPSQKPKNDVEQESIRSAEPAPKTSFWHKNFPDTEYLENSSFFAWGKTSVPMHELFTDPIMEDIPIPDDFTEFIDFSEIPDYDEGHNAEKSIKMPKVNRVIRKREYNYILDDNSQLERFLDLRSYSDVKKFSRSNPAVYVPSAEAQKEETQLPLFEPTMAQITPIPLKPVVLKNAQLISGRKITVVNRSQQVKQNQINLFSTYRIAHAQSPNIPISTQSTNISVPAQTENIKETVYQKANPKQRTTKKKTRKKKTAEDIMIKQVFGQLRARANNHNSNTQTKTAKPKVVDKWTDNEKNFLKSNFTEFGAEECAFILNKTQEEILEVASFLKLV